MSFSCDVRQCSWFDALTADLAAVNHASGDVLAKSIRRFDDHDLSDMNWLLDKYGSMHDHEILQAHRQMAGFPARISPRQRPMTVGEFNKAMALVEDNMSGAERAMRRISKMTKAMNRQQRPRINVGREIGRAREEIYAAQQRGEISTKVALEADVRLRSFALNRLQRLQTR